jgi:hypothetical protein
MRRKTILAYVLFTILVPFSITTIGTSSASSIYPAYATVGAFAYYSGNGGFIAYMSGVSANITYSVTNVYSNGTMTVSVDANLSLGTEASTAPTSVNQTLTDSVFNPKVFPALPPQDLNGSRVLFQNVSFAYVSNSIVTVPAGKFNATEYQGKDANGTVLQFWFDRSTGLALQEVEAASYFQLIQTNIATPLSTPSALQTESPFIIVFFVGWAGAGLFFYAIYRHYTKKSTNLNKRKSAL